VVERTTAFKRDETNTGVDQPTRTLLLVGSMNVHLGKEEKRKVFLGAVSSLVRVDVCVVTETWFREGQGEAMMSTPLEGLGYQ